MNHLEPNQTQLVYAFPRSPNEEIRFAIREYENRYYVDLRVWFKPEDGPGEMRPSRKGICVKPEQLAELSRGIQELHQAASGLNTKQKSFSQKSSPSHFQKTSRT